MSRATPGSSSASHPGPRRDPHHSLPRPPVPKPGTAGATLLLNATYEPLCVVSSRRAIVLVLASKAVAVDSAPDVVHAETVSLQVPIVTAGVGYPESLIHAPNENITVENFVLGTRHTALLIASYRGPTAVT